MTQGLKTYVLPEHPSFCSASMLGGLQLPVTSAPGTSEPSSGLPGQHTHVHIQVDTQIKIKPLFKQDECLSFNIP